MTKQRVIAFRRTPEGFIEKAILPKNHSEINTFLTENFAYLGEYPFEEMESMLVTEGIELRYHTFLELIGPTPEEVGATLKIREKLFYGPVVLTGLSNDELIRGFSQKQVDWLSNHLRLDEDFYELMLFPVE